MLSPKAAAGLQDTCDVVSVRGCFCWSANSLKSQGASCSVSHRQDTGGGTEGQGRTAELGGGCLHTVTVCLQPARFYLTHVIRAGEVDAALQVLHHVGGPCTTPTHWRADPRRGLGNLLPVALAAHHWCCCRCCTSRAPNIGACSVKDRGGLVELDLLMQHRAWLICTTAAHSLF